MLISNGSLAILVSLSIVLLAATDEGTRKNKRSFSLQRRFIRTSNTEHIILIGKNAVNMSVDDSIYHIHRRYSIHDRRLAIMNSNDTVELYKVMCNMDSNCRILQSGVELFHLKASAIREYPNQAFKSRQTFNIGSNWTMLIVPDEMKVMLFHEAYSRDQPLIELLSFKIFYPRSFNSTFSINIFQQPIVDATFLLAMGIMLDGM